MNEKRSIAVRPGQAIPRDRIPQLAFEDFRKHVVNAVGSGQRVAALFGDDSTGRVDLYAVLADSRQGLFRVTRTTLEMELDNPNRSDVAPTIIARLYTRLGENDNWIAGFCRYYGQPIISRDAAFDRVRALRRLDY